MFERPLIAIALLCALVGCVQHASNERYERGEVAVSYAVEFGTIAGVRKVQIYSAKASSGTLLGAGTGAGGGSYVGDGTGSVWAAAGGAIVGAVVGNQVDKELNNAVGEEYILHMQDGAVKTIVQEVNDENPSLNIGDKVMLRYCDAGNNHVKKCDAGRDFQRLSKVDEFPPLVEQNTKHKKSK